MLSAPYFQWNSPLPTETRLLNFSIYSRSYGVRLERAREDHVLQLTHLYRHIWRGDFSQDRSHFIGNSARFNNDLSERVIFTFFQA